MNRVNASPAHQPAVRDVQVLQISCSDRTSKRSHALTCSRERLRVRGSLSRKNASSMALHMYALPQEAGFGDGLSFGHVTTKVERL